MKQQQAETRQKSEETQSRLIDGTISVLRNQGFSGISACSIAGTAGVNQALIFYHFSSVNELASKACYANTNARVDIYRSQIERVDSIGELLEVGRSIYETEHKVGNVIVLAQVLAGGQEHPELAIAAENSLQIWIHALHKVVAPIIERSPLNGLVDTLAITQMASAAFIGISLYEGVKSSHLMDPFATLQPLAIAADLIDSLNPIAKKAIHSQLVRANRKVNTETHARKGKLSQ